MGVGTKALDGLFCLAFTDFVGDLFTEGVALIEDLAHGIDDAITVVVILGEDEGLGDPGHSPLFPLSFWEAFFEAAVSIGLDDGTDLVGGEYAAVQLVGCPLLFLIEHLEALFLGEAVAHLYGGARFDGVALLCHLGFDAVDVVTHIDLVDHGVFVGVFRDEVLTKEADGLFGGCGGEADEEGIEIFEHLTPEVVDGAVAFVDDDDIELFNGDAGVVTDRPWLFAERVPLYLKAGMLIGLIIQLLSGELRVHALDGGDGDLGGIGYTGAAQDVDVVVLGEFAAIVGDDELLKFILGIGAEVATVHQEQGALDLAEFGQAIDLGDGGVGFTGTGGHLQQGTGFALFEAVFDASDGLDLAVTQVFDMEFRQLPQACSEGITLFQPRLEGFGAVEVEDVAGAWMGVSLITKADLVIGSFIEEWQGLIVRYPALDVFGV